MEIVKKYIFTFRTGELMNRLSSDTQVIQNALTVRISLCESLLPFDSEIGHTKQALLTWLLTL